MAELKTKATELDPREFLETVDSDEKRQDCFWLLEQMEELSGAPAKMWGESMIGFGTYHYVYDSGREGDWFEVGFAPRKQNLVVYIMPGFIEYDDLLGQLGKYKTGKSCLYIKKLSDVNREVLRDLIDQSLKAMREKYGD
ncbi:DUF1801 domain-containing protein [Microvenator marinus]|uniref:DUF1801 domain-containing protein n=1 Tax=Microvenator marinus TaxID=2600177 RepID=A0A5B8XKM3_9DELT|nr:DUF1801 domain-containing protein [Microvenator marinus]QED26352.1 DUF1801 domain-containing protein [Microvenator marinus]